MKRVIKMSQAWIAALFLGLVLTGCGGSSSETASTTSPGSGGTGGSDSGTPPSEPVPDRTLVLSWKAPTTRVDGTELSPYELSKYVIHYGTDQNSLDQTLVIDNVGGVDDWSHEFTNLSSGTWYFTVQAATEGENEIILSEPTGVVSGNVEA